ncbi:MAG TPA: sulfite exporter TauE/SafE family protein [Pirellulaceae bacterium]|nr:sulfite exporter TauE/SafE family protein [Pirellulaceae bacterium]
MLSFWLALLLVLIVALAAGAIASVAGFGIGSLLTPLLGLQVEMKVAVAVISIPHFIATALRYWILRKHFNWRVLWSFGLTSAAGGLAGAFLGAFLASPLLTAVPGVLLVFAGVMGVTGYASKMRFSGWTAWVAGVLSGAFGGLVGNQGGIRSAALMGFDIRKDAFVATATAVGLLVDGARMPVYFLTQWSDIAKAWPYVAAATVGVVAGTIAGERLLRRIPETTFRKIVSAIILVLGIALLTGAAWTLWK